MIEPNDDNQSLLFALREAKRTCANKQWRAMLDEAANLLDAATRLFVRENTKAAMIALNGAWAYAERILKEAPPVVDPQPPLAGAPEAARLAA